MVRFARRQNIVASCTGSVNESLQTEIQESSLLSYFQ